MSESNHSMSDAHMAYLARKLDLKERELALREREIALAEKDAELREKALESMGSLRDAMEAIHAEHDDEVMSAAAAFSRKGGRA